MNHNKMLRIKLSNNQPKIGETKIKKITEEINQEMIKVQKEETNNLPEIKKLIQELFSVLMVPLTQFGEKD